MIAMLIFYGGAKKTGIDLASTRFLDLSNFFPFGEFPKKKRRERFLKGNGSG